MRRTALVGEGVIVGVRVGVGVCASLGVSVGVSVGAGVSVGVELGCGVLSAVCVGTSVGLGTALPERAGKSQAAIWTAIQIQVSRSNRFCFVTNIDYTQLFENNVEFSLIIACNRSRATITFLILPAIPL
jgi:hypothetical protein